MSTMCDHNQSEALPESLKELLCKAHAIGFSEEELAELRQLYGRSEEK